MSLQQLDITLTSKFDANVFLELAGQITGDKLGVFVADDINLPAAIQHSHKPKIFRGSSKGIDVIGIYAVELPNSTLKNGFKIRRQLANAILHTCGHNDAIVAFYAENVANWRLGFIRGYKLDTLEALREFSIGEGLAVRTAKTQLTTLINLPASTESSERSIKLNKAFSIEAVSDGFYDEFKTKHFDCISQSLEDQGASEDQAKEMALLFCIRVMFLGFVQKKNWLGDNDHFLEFLRDRYRQSGQIENFYSYWLKPLFFDALNSYRKPVISDYLPDEIKQLYTDIPYLNGGLFRPHDVDKPDISISDELSLRYFDFLFSYNFTIQENTLQEQSLELSPELLGIIFEKLVNKDQGAIYTPRTEVDFMCRMSLLKWLQKNMNDSLNISNDDLYELFFREGGTGKQFDLDQKTGSFSHNQSSAIIQLLENVTVCDPAVGSGAFPVGIMQVLEETLVELYGKLDTKVPLDKYKLRRQIIERSIYGVEVKKWAVWICQLRLWLALFLDAPTDLKDSHKAILPSLDFKILQGDSIVQMIGKYHIPVGKISMPSRNGEATKKLNKLRDMKHNYYQGDSKITLGSISKYKKSVYSYVVQEQIRAIDEKLGIINKQSHLEQSNLFGEEKPRTEQGDIFHAEIEALANQKNDLISYQKIIHEQDQFAWTIDFPEIFIERNGFDIVIGNPPYLTQDDISDPLLRINDPKNYRLALMESIRGDYWPNSTTNKFKAQSGFSGKSDLSIYFFFKTLRLLSQKGVHSFICTTSWIDAGYSSSIQNFILKKVPNFEVYDSRAKRSFANAGINTVISFMSAPSKQPKEPFKFITLKKSFEESVITETLSSIDRSDATVSNSEFRLCVKDVETLITEATTDDSFVGSKWAGMYLRSPDILTKIMDGASFRIGNFVEKERYLNTGGADGFFIVSNYSVRDGDYLIHKSADLKKGIKEFEGLVEQRYFRKLIKDSLKISRKIKADNPDALCFVVESEEKISDKATEYIKWGEASGYHNKSVTKLSRPWYKPTRQMLKGAKVIIPRSYNDIYVSHHNPERDLSLRYYRLHPKAISGESLVAFLNSTLYWLYVSALGNQAQGEGVLDVHMDDMLHKYRFPELEFEFMVMPKSLLERKIENIYIECGIDPESDTLIQAQTPSPLSDRAQLDKIIFDMIGLNDEERNNVYRGVCELVWNRLNKAKSV